MLNQIIVMGRLTNEPELKTTNSGISVTKFTVAVDRQYQKQGEEKVTDFIPCTAFRGNAEFITKYFKKGSLICVQGSLTTNKYTDNSGQKRTGFEILVDHAHFTGEKKTAENSAQSEPVVSTPPKSAPAQNNGYSNNGFYEIAGDDDIPF